MKKQINDLLFKMQNGENCIGETANALFILCVVSRQLKGLFLKKDKAMYCGYNVIVSEICSKKWCIITDENNHHYNARIKDLRPRTF